jgi:hypothetical protein
MIGAPATPLAAINPAKVSMPSRSIGNDIGSPISPCSPLASHTRLLTLPGSTATTSAVAGIAWRNSSTASHLLTNRKGPPCSSKSLTTKVAQELSAQDAAPVRDGSVPMAQDRAPRQWAPSLVLTGERLS